MGIGRLSHGIAKSQTQLHEQSAVNSAFPTRELKGAATNAKCI
jgi:hypothetical protein